MVVVIISFERRQKGQGTDAKEANRKRLVVGRILEDNLKEMSYITILKCFLTKSGDFYFSDRLGPFRVSCSRCRGGQSTSK